jgi:hypothetical protein
MNFAIIVSGLKSLFKTVRGPSSVTGSRFLPLSEGCGDSRTGEAIGAGVVW